MTQCITSYVKKEGRKGRTRRASGASLAILYIDKTRNTDTKGSQIDSTQVYIKR